MFIVKRYTLLYTNIYMMHIVLLNILYIFVNIYNLLQGNFIFQGFIYIYIYIYRRIYLFQNIVYTLI